jgi:heptosyltransferase-1
MRVLLIKTSSMGDVIHTLPAITDAGKALPGIRFDWVVEENFAEIPGWHPLVKNVIPIAWRRWRKQAFSRKTLQEGRLFYQKIRAEHYDVIIDAQGLLKSAFFSLLGRGQRAGLDYHSAREPLASFLYGRTYPVHRKQHAIQRLRDLFSQILKYPLPENIPEYGIDRQLFLPKQKQAPYVIFLHGTTWDTKLWPESYWLELASKIAALGLEIKLPWGNAEEKERSEKIAASVPRATVLPKLRLKEVAIVLAGAKAIVAVDTGLGHLAAALEVPTISLYGATDPVLTGALGHTQLHMQAVFPCAPCLNKTCTYLGESPFKSLRELNASSPLYGACFATLSPSSVWLALSKLL